MDVNFALLGMRFSLKHKCVKCVVEVCTKQVPIHRRPCAWVVGQERIQLTKTPPVVRVKLVNSKKIYQLQSTSVNFARRGKGI
jgi:hypothetical protein